MLQNIIILNQVKSLDVTSIHVIVNKVCSFHSSTEIFYNNHYVNLKSMKNAFQFFQQEISGEIVLTCKGYDEYYALQQITRVLERYLVGNRSIR